MNLILNDISSAFNVLKKKARTEYKKKNLEKCFFYIDSAVILSSQIVWKYTDNYLEKLILDISNSEISKINGKYQAVQNRVILFDSFGVNYILSTQYMRSLVALGKDILYIYEENVHHHTKLVPVIDIYRNYPNVSIQIIPYSESKVDKLQMIYDAIVSYQPSKIFTHIDSHSSVIPVLYSLPSEITRYHINLGDHLFWLGTKGIDYSFEFRSFGAIVSQEKRGLKNEQTLLLPYYPITEDKEFLGFPIECVGKVVIFSGGDFYKTIDKENTYWELVKNVLTENPNAVLLFATKLTNNEGPKILNQFIIENGFENRLLSIGFRPDINEVFNHCDIFMGTSPMSGGLMSQYAAVNAKPILQYYPQMRFPDNETESVICYNNNINISFTDKRDFLDEAKKLIENKIYRVEKGKAIKSCMITENQFNSLFEKSLEEHLTQVKIEKVRIQYEALTKWWMEIGNKGYFDLYGFVYEKLGFGGIISLPRLILTYLYQRYFKNKMFSFNWYKYKIIK